MPHVLIEYTQAIENEVDISRLVNVVHQGAFDSGLFPDAYDIKTRAIAYQYACMGGTQDAFIHVTVRLLSGRSDEQKSILTHGIVRHIRSLNLHVNSVTAEAVDMNRAVYAKDVIHH